MIQKFTVHPVGFIRNKQEECKLEILTKYIPSLEALEGFSHIHVLWWAHLFDNENDRSNLTAHPPYKTAPGEMGIFATRSPIRPNPIALTVVKVLGIDYQHGIINIPYIDAENASPILDVKPYHPTADRVREVNVPDWCDHWPKWHEDSADFDWKSELYL